MSTTPDNTPNSPGISSQEDQQRNLLTLLEHLLRVHKDPMKELYIQDPEGALGEVKRVSTKPIQSVSVLLTKHEGKDVRIMILLPRSF